MKHHFTLVCACALVAISAISCKSNEKKAAELIKAELYQTLYDFESYEPIETTVKKAYETAYNDFNCHQQAIETNKSMQKADEYTNAFEKAKQFMDIWEPGYYSSTYTKEQYNKYKRIFDENLEKAQEELANTKQLGLALQESIKKLNPQKQIGWVAEHRFRCKTRGGMPAIGHYRYIIDKKFKNIIFSYDTEDEEEAQIMTILIAAENGGFDKYATDEE